MLHTALTAARRGQEQPLSSRGRSDGGDVPPGSCCLLEGDGRHRRHDAVLHHHRIPHRSVVVTSAPSGYAALQADRTPYANTASSTSSSPGTGLPGRVGRLLLRRLAPTSRRQRPLPRPRVRFATFGGAHG
jgi:hypothetical protein